MKKSFVYLLVFFGMSSSFCSEDGGSSSGVVHDDMYQLPASVRLARDLHELTSENDIPCNVIDGHTVRIENFSHLLPAQQATVMDCDNLLRTAYSQFVNLDWHDTERSGALQLLREAERHVFSTLLTPDKGCMFKARFLVSRYMRFIKLTRKSLDGATESVLWLPDFINFLEHATTQDLSASVVEPVLHDDDGETADDELSNHDLSELSDCDSESESGEAATPVDGSSAVLVVDESAEGLLHPIADQAAVASSEQIGASEDSWHFDWAIIPSVLAALHAAHVLTVFFGDI